MSKGRKIAVALTRAFAGHIGVDCFIMKRVGKGVGRIILTTILTFFSCIAIIPYIGWIIGGIFEIILFIRWLIFLITGLVMLGKTPEEVARKY